MAVVGDVVVESLSLMLLRLSLVVSLRCYCCCQLLSVVVVVVVDVVVVARSVGARPVGVARSAGVARFVGATGLVLPSPNRCHVGCCFSRWATLHRSFAGCTASLQPGCLQ